MFFHDYYFKDIGIYLIFLREADDGGKVCFEGGALAFVALFHAVFTGSLGFGGAFTGSLTPGAGTSTFIDFLDSAFLCDVKFPRLNRKSPAFAYKTFLLLQKPSERFHREVP